MKKKIRVCYNCDAIKHEQKNCFHSLKKTTTKINAIRKNKIKIFLKFIEIKNWFEKLKKFVAIIVVVVTNLNEIKFNNIFIRVNVNIFEK